MNKIDAKWIAEYLNTEQKRVSVEASRSICVHFAEDVDYFNGVVTMDETWIHFYDPQTK